MRYQRLILALVIGMGGIVLPALADTPQLHIVHHKAPDDLEPEPGLVGGFSWDRGIAIEWHRRLLADAGHWPRCLTLVDEPDQLGRKGEVAVWLSRGQKHDVIFVRRASESIGSWLFEKAVAEVNPGRQAPGEAPRVTAVEAVVDPAVADVLEKSWEMMMNRVVQPRGEPIRSSHPSWIHFAHWDEVWTYRSGRFQGFGFEHLLEVEPTKPRPVQLASLARWMVEYVETPAAKRKAIRDVLFQRASKFVDSLRRLGEPEPDIRMRRSRQAPPLDPPSSEDLRRARR